MARSRDTSSATTPPPHVNSGQAPSYKGRAVLLLWAVIMVSPGARKVIDPAEIIVLLDCYKLAGDITKTTIPNKTNPKTCNTFDTFVSDSPSLVSQCTPASGSNLDTHIQGLV